jgi:hypothetical protein
VIGSRNIILFFAFERVKEFLYISFTCERRATLMIRGSDRLKWLAGTAGINLVALQY